VGLKDRERKFRKEDKDHERKIEKEFAQQRHREQMDLLVQQMKLTRKIASQKQKLDRMKEERDDIGGVERLQRENRTTLFYIYISNTQTFIC